MLDNDYFALTSIFLPRMIHNDEALEPAIVVVDGLLDRPDLSSDARDYLAVLAC